jgi:RNA methyltransferase, TrmH family
MITSLQNPLIKRVVALRDRKNRDKQRVFLIEGRKEIQCALSNGISPEMLFYCPDILNSNAGRKATCAGLSPHLFPDDNQKDDFRQVAVPPRVYAKIAYREKVGGLVLVAHTPDRRIEHLKLSGNPFILIVQGVEKPGNLGAMLRIADGAGVDAVIIVKGRGVDLYNPNVVRSSLGSLFTVKTFAMSLDKTMDWLTANQIKIVLSSPSAQQYYTDIDYTGPVAVVVGSEKEGLPQRLLDQNVTTVKIPMCGQMDSLNVSCSGAVLMYEVLRQRSSIKKR